MRITDLAAIAVVAVVATSSTVVFAEPSDLDKANARKLFNEGLDLRKSGDQKGALAKLEAADAIFATPKGRLELGRQRMLVGQLVEAYTTLLSVANVEVAAKDQSKYTAHRAEAAKLATELEGRIPTLQVKIDGVPAGKSATVHVDGAMVPNAALVEPRMVNPGNHVVIARIDDGPPSTSEVTVKEGDKRVVVLKVTPPAPVAGAEQASPDAPPPTSFRSEPTPTPKDVPPQPAASDTQKTIAIVTAGVGVVGLGLGTYFGLSAHSKSSDADKLCPTSTTCTSTSGVTLRHDAITKANLSTYSFIGAAALLGGAAVLWFTAPSHAESKPQTALVVGPGSVGLRTVF